MLVLIGATSEGKKELIGFRVGVRGSAQSWHELHRHKASRDGTNEGEFQDRCLKPLGHPSILTTSNT
jgi:hypothetical protein